MKTLIVEDNKTSGKLLKALLKSKTNQTVLVENGLEALEKLKHTTFDLIISDVQMPQLDGFTMILHIRNNAHLKHIPIILYSAIYTNINFEQMALEYGANRFVKKDGSTKEIMAAASEFIGES